MSVCTLRMAKHELEGALFLTKKIIFSQRLDRPLRRLFPAVWCHINYIISILVCLYRVFICFFLNKLC